MTATSLPVTRSVPAPRPALLGAIGLGIGAGWVIPNGAPGVGLVLLGVAGALLLLRLAPAPVRGWRAVHASLALLLLAVVAVRSAPWLVALDLAMALALGSLALTSARSWPGVLRGLVEVGLVLPRTAGWLAGAIRQLPLGRSAAGPIARGLALTALLLAVFVPLLVSADAAFATLVEAALPGLPDLSLLPVRVAVSVIAAVGVGAGTRVLLIPRREPVVGGPVRRLHRATEWLLPLAVLDGVLALFLAVQAGAMFGGDRHILEAAGVTYASYAREGFGQLVAVTALVLAVVAAAVRWAPRAARPALGVLCALALVVDASALWRLQLYVDAYGLTRLRVTASAIAVWLGIVLVAVLVAGVRPGRWLPHTVVAAAAAGLLALSAANPDARIADSVLDRGRQADLAYVAGLSADAAAQLDRLPEPDRTCALERAAMVDSSHSWTSANVARSRARQLLAEATCAPEER